MSSPAATPPASPAPFTFTSVDALRDAIQHIPRGLDTHQVASETDDVARREFYVQNHIHQSSMLALCYTADPALGQPLTNMISRYSRMIAATQAEITVLDSGVPPPPAPPPGLPPAAPGLPPAAPIPAAAAPPAPPGMRPKQPTITKCNLSGGSVKLFLTSMHTACSTLTFTDDKQKAHYYVNNLTDSSRELLFSVHNPVTDDPWYTTANVINYLESFISKNKNSQALQSLRNFTMQGHQLFVYYQKMSQLISETNSSPETTLSQSLQVRYFVEGLNPNAIPTNLKLAIDSFLRTNPASTITDLYQHAEHLMDTVYGPNHRSSTNNITGNFVIPKRGRSGGNQPRHPNPKQQRLPSSAARRDDYPRQPPRHPTPGRQPSGNTCQRCGHNHKTSDCSAQFHISGELLTTPKNKTNPPKVTPGGFKGNKTQGSYSSTLPSPPPPVNPWKKVGNGKGKGAVNSLTAPPAEKPAPKPTQQQQQQQRQQLFEQQQQQQLLHQQKNPHKQFAVKSIIVDPAAPGPSGAKKKTPRRRLPLERSVTFADDTDSETSLSDPDQEATPSEYEATPSDSHPFWDPVAPSANQQQDLLERTLLSKRLKAFLDKMDQ